MLMALMHWICGVKVVFNLLRSFSNGIGHHICSMTFDFPSLLHFTLIAPSILMHALLLKTFSSTQASQILNVNSQMPMMTAIVPCTHTWLLPRNPFHWIFILLLCLGL